MGSIHAGAVAAPDSRLRIRGSVLPVNTIGSSFPRRNGDKKPPDAAAHPTVLSRSSPATAHRVPGIRTRPTTASILRNPLIYKEFP